jgi:hypothetical protein
MNYKFLYEIFNVKKYMNGRYTYYWLFLLLVLFVVGNIVLIYATKFEKNITISEKYVRPYGKSGRYRVVDDKDNTYTVGDNIFLLEFNSADDYAKLKEGVTYHVYGYWFRFPLFSWFPVIYKLDEK